MSTDKRPRLASDDEDSDTADIRLVHTRRFSEWRTIAHSNGVIVESDVKRGLRVTDQKTPQYPAELAVDNEKIETGFYALQEQVQHTLFVERDRQCAEIYFTTKGSHFHFTIDPTGVWPNDRHYELEVHRDGVCVFSSIDFDAK